MILPDAAIWIDHFRRADPRLAALLASDRIMGHPFVTGEVMLGSIASRAATAEKLDGLPQLRVATVSQVAILIEERQAFGRGIGYVDAHLLASILLSPGTFLWTRDKRLKALADRLSIAFEPG